MEEVSCSGELEKEEEGRSGRDGGGRGRGEGEVGILVGNILEELKGNKSEHKMNW